MRMWQPGRSRVQSFCGAPLQAAQPRQVRKFVSVLFCDLTGSGLGDRTDPEALRAMMRYYDNARAVLEDHGGMIEKFTGGAVMAVFGIPVATEVRCIGGRRWCCCTFLLCSGIHHISSPHCEPAIGCRSLASHY